MGVISRALNRIRKRLLRVGYTCDVCGGELFDYPAHRLCSVCESKLPVSTRPCERCGREKVADGLCLTCKSAPPVFTRGVSVFPYKGEGANLVNRFKNGYPKLAGYLGERMADRLLVALPALREDVLLLLSVPLTKDKGRERGFNQAERLTECILDRLLARGVKAEADFTALEKSRETKPQKRMTAAERAENVRGAYRVREREKVEGRTVVLVDDVMTTGATANEIARRLFKAGAQAVYFLTATATPEQK